MTADGENRAFPGPDAGSTGAADPGADARRVVVLVDASPYLFRAFHAVPRTVVARDGSAANAIYGFLAFLVRVIEEEHPSHLAIAFDADLVRSFRSDLDPRYKAHREEPPPDLVRQVPDCIDAVAAIGALAIVAPGYEADDLIATLVARMVPGIPGVESGPAADAPRILVVSGDKDLAALVSPRVTLLDLAASVRLGPEEVRAKLGVAPEHVVDLLALAGDPVDGIPGVAGIGRKTAAALIQHLGTLEAIYAAIDRVPGLPIRGARGVAERLARSRADAYLSKRLATLATDAPLGPASDLAALRYRGPFRERLAPFFDRVGFGTLRRRIEAWPPAI